MLCKLDGLNDIAMFENAMLHKHAQKTAGVQLIPAHMQHPIT
jgi:hypothetical protein